MSTLALDIHEARSLNRHALLGTVAVFALIGAMGYWAATTQIAGAVVATGSIAIDGGTQRIQHQEGGIVKAIHVQDDTEIAAGEPVISLDGTAISANIAVIDSQLADAYARQARLVAESTDAGHMVWDERLETIGNVEQNRILFAAEDRLRTVRAAALATQIGQLQEQIVQLENQSTGLEAQHVSITDQVRILSDQVDSLSSLLERGLVEAARVVELRRSLAQLEGEGARLLTEIARGNAAISERRLQISQTQEAFRSEVLSSLQETVQNIAQLEQQRIAAQDRLDRLEIRAPISGVVHELQIATIGGVISPGETLMQIVPQDMLTMAEVRVSPLDIDKLALNQTVKLKLSSFNSRYISELAGQVDRISPDLSRDPVTGGQYYLVRVRVSDEGLHALAEGVRLIPGMPTEAFFATSERTVLDYLVTPVRDQLERAFLED